MLEGEPQPYRLRLDTPGLGPALEQVEREVKEAFPDLGQARWVALRLLEGDRQVIEAVRSGEIGELDGLGQEQETMAVEK